MELLLNAVWAIISGLVIARLLEHRQRRFEPKQLLHLGALLCAALILFPSISVSDDIHSEPFIVEDSRLARHIAGAKSFAGAVPLIWLAIISSPILLATGHRQWWLISEFSETLLRPSPLLRDFLGRAPPAALTTPGVGC